MIGAPRDPAWAVWADRLQALGDPRGELIALELLPESERSPAQIERLAALYQPLIARFESHSRALLPGGWLTREVRCWRFGYVVELTLAQVMAVPNQPSYSALFGADELRCLSSLYLSLAQEQVEPLLDALERHHPPLTELMFFSHEAVADFDELACERLWTALPALQLLRFSPFTSFAHINHPGLTTISLLPEPGGNPQGLELVARSELPALVRVENFGVSYDPEALNLLLQGQKVMSLLERLEVFEYPALFFFLYDYDGSLEALRGLATASRLRSSATILAICPPQLAAVIRERLPQLHFEFIEMEENYLRFSLPPERKVRVMLGWPCGQPNLEFPGGLYLSQRLAWMWAEMDAEQQRGAAELILALDTSECGQPIEFNHEALHRVLRGGRGDSSCDSAIAALERHRACCPEVVLMVEACAEEGSWSR